MPPNRRGPYIPPQQQAAAPHQNQSPPCTVTVWLATGIDRVFHHSRAMANDLGQLVIYKADNSQSTMFAAGHWLEMRAVADEPTLAAAPS